MDISMELVGVRVELPDNTPVLLLREQGGQRRLLPILIGNPEATSIHFALEGIQSPRPLTHDLFTETISMLGGALKRVVITEVREHTYFAELTFETAIGQRVISGRPSDALALAVRTDAEIFARSTLLDEVAQAVVESALAAGEGEESILDEFRDFIENISPEDFSG
jgi:bifunctional DNase/RNase